MPIRELKVCLLGDSDVGKTSIIYRFTKDRFEHTTKPTIGAFFVYKAMSCGKELHKFLIWDTAGHERFADLLPMYYRGSTAAVIVYDITRWSSFHTLKKWVQELKEHEPEDIIIAIAGNKCDLSDVRKVPLEMAKDYAESIGAIYLETSAKSGHNITELFKAISQRVPPLSPGGGEKNVSIKLHEPKQRHSPPSPGAGNSYPLTVSVHESTKD
ncbi:ras-related protein Rab-31 [Dryobates pubescens]|uniref:ras-related protein Rab-31 n=1 Tax=Dryobates pubescens TaxID=118200 RepID=UPI0023B8B034|nr:ras-related protein Rab-31 [Dryobates pubescens]